MSENGTITHGIRNSLPPSYGADWRRRKVWVTWEYLEVCEGGKRTVPARALDQVDVADDAGAYLVVD